MRINFFTSRVVSYFKAIVSKRNKNIIFSLQLHKTHLSFTNVVLKTKYNLYEILLQDFILTIQSINKQLQSINFSFIMRIIKYAKYFTFIRSNKIIFKAIFNISEIIILIRLKSKKTFIKTFINYLKKDRLHTYILIKYIFLE